MKRLLFIFFVAALFAPFAQAVDINAASCSRADVNTAITSAVDGDRVLIPAENCIWTTPITVTNKGITIEGAGVGSTIIQSGSNSRFFIINLQAGDPTFVLTGITFDANSANTGSNALIEIIGGGSNAFRFHHAEMNELVERGIVISQDGLLVSGLIDHVTFNMPGTGGSKAISVFGTGAQENQPFSFPFALGSANFIFVEDCTFNFGGRNDGALDAYGGARYVFRHNTVIGTNVEHHGADSGGYRGVHSFEIYENTFSCTGGCANQRLHHFRSGTGVVFNNTYTGNYSGMELSNYRSCGSFAPYGICSGSSSWDENQSGQEGYACLDQCGHIFGTGTGGTNALEPLYEWNNLLNGADVNFSLSAGPGCARHNLHIVANRDYYNNTQRPGYTSFTYPHSLQGATGAPAVSTSCSLCAVMGTVQIENTTSATLTLTNTGDATLNVSADDITSGTTDFSITGQTCAATLGASLNCTYTIQCKTKTVGSRTGNFRLTSSAAGSPHDVALACTGKGVATAAP